ncbi:MAG: tRNA threonylcarbamoyladenosine dehydratase [Hyphomonadaceae bacterium]|nr:tRNA threonylcarbamoyladenosine dehydratase [Clostridia bacterium]
MLHAFSRTEMLIGREGLEKLKNSTVAVFGIGGVGTYAVEGLVRAGVGNFVLVDDDVICLTNLNRQLHATRQTVGKSKVEMMHERILSINPQAQVTTHAVFVLPENVDTYVLEQYDYIIDAVDTVTAKLTLIETAKAKSIPIISCMGTGNKLDPTQFEVVDITKTSVCPLARVMRQELKNRGIKKLKVLYSKEQPLVPQGGKEGCAKNCICPKNAPRTCDVRRQIPGSISFVPSVAGLILAGEVVKDLIGEIVHA